MNKSMISPSMMCADLTDLKKQVEQLEHSGTEFFHIDVMDGHFVPNLMLGNGFVEALRSLSKIPMDFHFMVERPEEKMPWFNICRGDIVSVHYESTPHLNKALQYIKQCGAYVFVAINPATPVYLLSSVLDDIDGVLIMTVNPGFAGQKLVESTLKKIAELRTFLDDNGKENALIEVDGNVSLPNATKMRRCGADIFVAGTSSVFVKDISLRDGMANLRLAIAEGEKA